MDWKKVQPKGIISKPMIRNESSLIQRKRAKSKKKKVSKDWSWRKVVRKKKIRSFEVGSPHRSRTRPKGAEGISRTLISKGEEKTRGWGGIQSDTTRIFHRSKGGESRTGYRKRKREEEGEKPSIQTEGWRMGW